MGKIDNGGDRPPLVAQEQLAAGDLSNIDAGDAVAFINGTVTLAVYSPKVRLDLLSPAGTSDRDAERRSPGARRPVGDRPSKSERKAEGRQAKSERKAEKSKQERKAEKSKSEIKAENRQAKSERKAESGRADAESTGEKSKSERKADDRQGKSDRKAELETAREERKAEQAAEREIAKQERKARDQLSKEERKAEVPWLAMVKTARPYEGRRHHRFLEIKSDENSGTMIFRLGVANSGRGEFAGSVDIFDRLPEGLGFVHTTKLIERRPNVARNILLVVPYVNALALALPEFLYSSMPLDSWGFQEAHQGSLLHYRMDSLKLEPGRAVLVEFEATIAGWNGPDVR